ncbi:hypothetical protein AVEN_259626-1 [Araneus ventricosus]|uniref:Uncharacterized protein n=1 Tax=Araneus ventricosus TaxID=182803 RepID=A0A4Y2VZL1_ARAVE|nr:hypothetical protein AVEN_259626-1 [Araneus ventricosus]
MTRTTPVLATPSPSFRATPKGGRLTTTYDLAHNRPHTRRIFNGIGFRTCEPPIPRSKPYHSGTTAINGCHRDCKLRVYWNWKSLRQIGCHRIASSE